MNILFVDDNYNMDVNSSDDQNTINLIEKWEEYGHVVDVLRPNWIFKELIKKRKIFSSGIYEQNLRIIFNYNFLSLFTLNPLEKIREDVDLNRYDIIVANSFFSILFCEKLFKKINLPLVYCAYDFEYRVFKDPLLKIIFASTLKQAYRHARIIAASSPALIKKFRSIFPNIKNKFFLGVSGIDRNSILNREKMFKKLLNWKKTGKVKILTTSNFVENTNLETVFKNVEKLDAVDWRLEVVSFKENVEDRYKIMTKELLISKKVKFSLINDKSEIAKKFEDADIFILSNKNMNFGKIYLDAMAKGCLTFCSKDCGIDGIINNVNGFIVNEKSFELARLLNKICKTDCEKLNKIISNMYKTVIKYTNERVCANYTEKICSVVDFKKIKDDEEI